MELLIVDPNFPKMGKRFGCMFFHVTSAD